jgi:hypothetical protein
MRGNFLALTGLAASAVMVGAPAWAANWKVIPGFETSYVDMASVRKDEFQDPNCRFVGCLGTKVTYTVAWLRTTQGATIIGLEVAFDCHGKMGAIQQKVSNETKESQYHSFDNTQAFKQRGVFLRGIPPDTLYDAAQKLVCK